MSNCLGIYIENNLIKYAKISKVNDNIKVESFGVRFYEKIDEAIAQIVQETYSLKTPISINLSEEMYNFFDMFALLSKNDLKKAISTEFESFCSEKGYNPNVFESRYAIVNQQMDKEKVKIIHIAENKIELNKSIQQIDGYNLTNISPVAMSIPNLIDTEKAKNVIIVNIEEQTSITTILDNKIYDINNIEEGSEDFLGKINLKENSYLNSYEICKNTTIYTSEGKELQEEETSYLEDIMPTLHSIVGNVKKIINSSTEKFEKIYITGTAALINNIDLYFQEYLSEVDCEILKPYFVQNPKDISIKDYIEVNSAISLGLMGVGEGIEGMNFKKQTIANKLPNWLTIDVNLGKTEKEKKNSSGLLTWNLGQRLSKSEMGLIRVAISLLLLVIIYSGFSGVLANQMNLKKEKAQESIDLINEEISKVNIDNEKIKTKTNEYNNMVKNLEEANNKITERARMKNAIPNLLNQIMSIVPEGAQITSIENLVDGHVIITAQSNKYAQLGYLIAKLKTDVILTNVISTAGQKDNGIVTVQIEGDLP